MKKSILGSLIVLAAGVHQMRLSCSSQPDETTIES